MNEQFPKFVIVPYEKLDELLHKVDTLTESISSMKMDKGVLGDYISEKEAREILSKATTWFWNKRQSGELTGRKAGNKWYYKRSDSQKFIENGQRI